jgi:hypothetical protein
MNKGVLAVVVVFLGFWLFTDPDGLANVSSNVASGGWDWTQQFFSSVIEFVGKL